MIDKTYLTTGQAAKMCGVSARSICKAVDAGIIKGFRIPTSSAKYLGQRRILTADMLAYMTANNIPLQGDSNDSRKEEVESSPQGLLEQGD